MLLHVNTLNYQLCFELTNVGEHEFQAHPFSFVCFFHSLLLCFFPAFCLFFVISSDAFSVSTTKGTDSKHTQLQVQVPQSERDVCSQCGVTALCGDVCAHLGTNAYSRPSKYRASHEHLTLGHVGRAKARCDAMLRRLSQEVSGGITQ